MIDEKLMAEVLAGEFLGSHGESAIRDPKSYMPLTVYAQIAGGGPGAPLHGMTFIPGRGFVEPITNRSLDDVGLKVHSWNYSAVPLWRGATVMHIKRRSIYKVRAIVSYVDIGDVKDDDVIEIDYSPYPGTNIRSDCVKVQVSTENYSPEWALYRSIEPGSVMDFVRPLSEFTPDRFKILYNGA